MCVNNNTLLLQGSIVAAHILESVKNQVKQFSGRPPCVVFIRVGQNGASVSYVAQKEKKAKECGIRSILKVFDEATTSEQDLLSEIERLNQDVTVDGILVQAPLPKSMNFTKIVGSIRPEKDVDGFGAYNCGRLMQDQAELIPCTPAGIIEILKYYNIQTAGKHVVIVNRSLIVGKPLAMLLMKHSEFGDATVTVCHSKTENLEKITQQADVLILACGKPHVFTKNFIKPGAVVIDVGITRVPANNERGYVLQGDCAAEDLAGYVSAITPVPGGVGPMTVAMLMKNTLKAYKLCQKQL